MKPGGVTNDQLEVCAGCDYRLSYDELRSELSNLHDDYRWEQEVKLAWKSKYLKILNALNVAIDAIDFYSDHTHVDYNTKKARTAKIKIEKILGK